MFWPVGFAAALHSSANIEWRTKRLQLELLVTAAKDMSLSPADCFHVVDTVVHTLLNIRSRKCSENSSGYMPTVKGRWWWKSAVCRISSSVAGWTYKQSEWEEEERCDHCLCLCHPSLWAVNRPDLLSRSLSTVFVITSEKVPTRSKHAAQHEKHVFIKPSSRFTLGRLSAQSQAEDLIDQSICRQLHPELYVFQILKKTVLHPESWSFAATGFFFFFPQLVVALGWTAAYLPNTILERGKTVWCKNLMKATNLCEWLRGITLVRREKKWAQDAHFFGGGGGGMGGASLNLCKQSKKFMSDDQSWPLFDHP